MEHLIIRGTTMALAFLLPVVFWPDAATAKQAVVLVLGGILGGALVWRMATGRGSPLDWFEMAWLAYLGTAALSLAVAATPYQGAKALWLLALACSICLATAQAWRSDDLSRRLMAAISVGAVTAALLSLGASLRSIEPQVGVVPFGNTNFAGAYFAMTAPLVLGVALDRRRGLRWLSGGAFLLLTVTLILTKARGGWVAFIAAITVMAACQWRVRGFRWQSAILGSLVAGLVGLVSEAALRFRGESLWSIAATILDPSQPTNQARLVWWGDTLRMIMDAPLLGTGLGNFSYAYPRYASLERLPFLQHNPYLEHPHNEYLGLAAEVGLPGLAVFIGLLLLGAVAARRALKARDDRLGEITGLAGAGIAGAVNALFFYTWHSPAGIIFWIVLGLLWALGQRPSDLPPRFPAQRGRSARLAVAGLAVAGIAIATFFFGIRPSVSSHFGQRARTDWYGLRGTEALEGFRRAFAWESENYLVPFEAGMGFFRANMFPQAAEAFAEAARLHPTHLAARNNLGLSLARLGDIPGARRAYQEALRINPEYAVARNNLANILLAENDLSGAIAEYRRALRSYPEYAEAWYNLGVALAQTGQTAEGITAFRRAAEIDPKMTEATSRAEELAAHLVGGRNLGAPKL